LLAALPEERTSARVKSVIAEERRRFSDERIGVKFHGPQWIGSPMRVQSFERATDEDILNAFRNLPDASGWDHPRDWHKGGNIQLSREFAEFAKIHQERAMRIIERFEPAFGTRAAGYALGALAEKIDANVLLSLIRSLDKKGFTGDEFRAGTSGAVVKLVEREQVIDDETFKMLERWLAKDRDVLPETDRSDDETEDLFDSGDRKKRDPSLQSVLWGHGDLTVLPSGNFQVLEALTRILLHAQDYERLISVYSSHLQVKEDSKVWQALLSYFKYVRPENAASFEKFLSGLFEEYPDLIFSTEAAVMLAYLQWRSPGWVYDRIVEWKDDARKRVQRTLGELVTLVALVQPAQENFRALLKELLEAPEMKEARVGAAYTAVNLWNERERRPLAAKVLVEIIPQANQDAWHAVFDLFRIVDEITPEPEWVLVLEAIAKHMDSADKLDSSFVVERLQSLLPHHALLVADVAAGLIRNWRDQLDDYSTRISADAPDLVDLAITLHRLGPETREAGTSLFEQLLVVSARTARDTLNQIDNRFRGSPPRPRRRLPRRNRRAPARVSKTA
jgi:hypothetical protein